MEDDGSSKERFVVKFSLDALFFQTLSKDFAKVQVVPGEPGVAPGGKIRISQRKEFAYGTGLVHHHNLKVF